MFACTIVVSLHLSRWFPTTLQLIRFEDFVCFIFFQGREKKWLVNYWKFIKWIWKDNLNFITLLWYWILTCNRPRTLISTPPSNVGCESTAVMILVIFWNVKLYTIKDKQIAFDQFKIQFLFKQVHLQLTFLQFLRLLVFVDPQMSWKIDRSETKDLIKVEYVIFNSIIGIELRKLRLGYDFNICVGQEMEIELTNYLVTVEILDLPTK